MPVNLEKCENVKTTGGEKIMTGLSSGEYCNHKFLTNDSGVCQITSETAVQQQAVGQAIGRVDEDPVTTKLAQLIAMDNSWFSDTTYIPKGNTTGQATDKLTKNTMGIDLCIFADPIDEDDCCNYYNADTGELCTSSPSSATVIKCTSAARNYPGEDDEIDIFDQYWYAHCEDIPECGYETGENESIVSCDKLSYDFIGNLNIINGICGSNITSDTCKNTMADACKSAYPKTSEYPYTCRYDYSSRRCEDDREKSGRFPWCSGAESAETPSDRECHLQGHYYCASKDQCLPDCSECDNINTINSTISNSSGETINICDSFCDYPKKYCRNSNSCIDNCNTSCANSPYGCLNIHTRMHECIDSCNNCSPDGFSTTYLCNNNNECGIGCIGCPGTTSPVSYGDLNICEIGPQDCGANSFYCHDEETNTKTCVSDCYSECRLKSKTNGNECVIGEKDCHHMNLNYCSTNPITSPCVDDCAYCSDKPIAINDTCRMSCDDPDRRIRCESTNSCVSDCSECPEKYYCAIFGSCVNACTLDTCGSWFLQDEETKRCRDSRG